MTYDTANQLCALSNILFSPTIPLLYDVTRSLDDEFLKNSANMWVFVSCRRLQEVFLAVGDDGICCGVDTKSRWTNKEVFQLSNQRQTNGWPPTTVDVSFSHCLQHESHQEVSVAGHSRHGSEEQEKASDRL